MINCNILIEPKKFTAGAALEPKVLVVTPLYTGHKISRETKVTIKRNDIPFIWMTAEGKFNIPMNVTLGLNWFKAKFNYLPEYFLMIDRDITLGRCMIDKMYKRLAPFNLPNAYTYANMVYKGHINQAFPARPFDIRQLIQHNYISSNSLFRMDVLQEVGLVTDEKYKRLLDWAFLLKLFKNGYIGIPCLDANFVVNSTENDISAGTPQDYNLKRNRVLVDFVKPITEEYHKAVETENQEKEDTIRMEF